MRDRDSDSKRSPRAPSGSRPRSSGTGKRDNKPRTGGGFKSRSEGLSSDRRPYQESHTDRGPRRPSEGATSGYRDSGRSTERGAGGFRNSERSTERNVAGNRNFRSSASDRNSASDTGRVGRFGEKTRSSEWSTGGYRIMKKGAGKSKSKEPWKYTDQAADESRAPRRDSEPRTGGFRDSGRSAEPRVGGLRDSRRSVEPGSGGFRDSRRSAEPRSGGFRDPKRGFDPKGPRRTAPNKKYDNQSSKNIALKKQEAVIDNNEAEDEQEDYRIEGRNPVFEALRSGRPLNKLFVEKDKNDTLISRIIAMAREKDIPIQYFDRSKLDSISQTRSHQGVILEVAAKEYVEIEDILAAAAENEQKPFLLVLDGITDTNNLGSIIRSAECSGVHGIVIPKRRSATLNATVAKVAAGAMEYVPVARVANLVQTLQKLKEQGLWIIGADMEGEKDYYDTDLTGPCALVIGSEGEGLSRLVKDECDLMVKIPMKGKIASLNAGVAAALVMFEISKQRGL